MKLDPGAIAFGFVAEGVKRLRKRIKARRTRKKMASWYAEHGGQPIDEVPEDFNVPTDEVSMNATLLLPILGSVARTFLPAATAFLAGQGIAVDANNPWLTLALAGAVYGGMQAWSILRKVKRAKSGQ